MIATGCTVVWGETFVDEDGDHYDACWIANLVFDYDGEALYRNVGESPLFQAACKMAMDEWERQAAS